MTVYKIGKTRISIKTSFYSSLNRFTNSMLGLEVLNLAFGPEHRLSECTVRSVESDHGSKEVFLIQGVGKYCADPAIEQMIPCSFEGTFNLNTHALELEAYLPKKNPDY